MRTAMMSGLGQWLGRRITGRWTPPVLFALLATALAMFARQVEPTAQLVRKLNNVWYDFLYRHRTPIDMSQSDVVVVTVDQTSLTYVEKAAGLGWPWPRDKWADAVRCIAACEPRAIVFDMLFTEVDRWEADFGGDAALGATVDSLRVPVIFGTMVGEDGRPGPFAPKVSKPLLGAVNIIREDDESERVRFYKPFVEGHPSLAVQALSRTNSLPKDAPAEAFRLHFYGPHVRSDGQFTLAYQPISQVLDVGQQMQKTGDATVAVARFGRLFRGKYVLIGATAPAMYDLGATPLDDQAPRVELHAAAIENLLRGDRVLPLGTAWVLISSLFGSLGASFAASVPRGVWAKLFSSVAILTVLMGASALLFFGPTIEWLPIMAAMIAAVATVIFSLGWSYGVEDRQARLFLKALSQSLSPAVADEIRRDPKKLNIGGQRKHMSVLFSDIAGFTDLSESLEVEKLNEVLNYYLNRMSAVVIEANGTLDKYIGDAIMAFWNAPLNQTDHAVRACRTALRLVQCEKEMQEELAKRGAAKLLTRIGINTGDMAVGNLGSDVKFSYTVIGDSVNLAARLEGANKLYGSQICISQSTADAVGSQFLLRQLDVLRVKGKKKPMAVYEVLSEDEGTERQRQIARRYEAALRLYQAQNWDQAEATLLELLRGLGEDGPSKALLARISKFRDDSPGVDWDGVYVAKDK